jgi:hypothetical protein
MNIPIYVFQQFLQQFVQQQMAAGKISNADFEQARQIANQITGLNL